MIESGLNVLSYYNVMTHSRLGGKINSINGLSILYNPQAESPANTPYRITIYQINPSNTGEICSIHPNKHDKIPTAIETNGLAHFLSSMDGINFDSWVTTNEIKAMIPVKDAKSVTSPGSTTPSLKPIAV